jgi:hypothetical protein
MWFERSSELRSSELRSSELRSSGVQNVFQMGIQTPPEREPLNLVQWGLETQE